MSSLSLVRTGSVYQWLLYGAFALAITLVIAVATTADERLVMALPLLVLSPLIVLIAWRYPLVNIGILFTLFILSSRNETGIGVTELLFGAYFVPYLCFWYGTRIFVYREPLIRQRGDLALLVFLGWVLVSVPLGALAGGTLAVAASELANFSLLALYFPLRELVVRRDTNSQWLLGFIVALGIIAVGKNLILFKDVVDGAVDLRGIARGRIAVNEVLIYISAVAALGATLYLRSWTAKLWWGCGFLICTFGVVITQYRAFYLALAVAMLVAFLVGSREQRTWLVGTTVVSILGLSALAALVLGDMFVIFATGIIDRIASIGSAHQEDISMINRLIEYKYAWHEVLKRPIIGHGLGAEYGFYDALYKNTRMKPYIHNAYLHMWYKLGAFGLLLLLYISVVAGTRGIQLARAAASTSTERAGGLFAVASLVGLAVAGYASVLYNSDTMLPLAVCLAVVAGLDLRHHHRAEAAEPGEV